MMWPPDTQPIAHIDDSTRQSGGKVRENRCSGPGKFATPVGYQSTCHLSRSDRFGRRPNKARESGRQATSTVARSGR